MSPCRGASALFSFGVEKELLLVERETFRPLWHTDVSFAELNAALESIDVRDVPRDGLELERPHRKLMPFVAEGYHLPDREMNPVDLLPKGVEIRTPKVHTVEGCVAWLRELASRLDRALGARGWRAVALSHHPIEHGFEGPQNRRREDFWRWAMSAMVTYGPDVNVGLPPEMFARLDVADLHAKVNHYAPALTALTVASPIYRGALWKLRGRTGKSIRTYTRSMIAPALEIHPNQHGRLELKTFEASCRFSDYAAFLLMWLALLLDEGLSGRAADVTRIYDLGAVARDGLGAELVVERAAEVLERAPDVLARWGFDPAPLAPMRARLDARAHPADDIAAVFEREGSVAGLLRHLVPS